MLSICPRAFVIAVVSTIEFESPRRPGKAITVNGPPWLKRHGSMHLANSRETFDATFEAATLVLMRAFSGTVLMTPNV
jgi:hypothetical protein